MSLAMLDAPAMNASAPMTAELPLVAADTLANATTMVLPVIGLNELGWGEEECEEAPERGFFDQDLPEPILTARVWLQRLAVTVGVGAGLMATVMGGVLMVVWPVLATFLS